MSRTPDVIWTEMVQIQRSNLAVRPGQPDYWTCVADLADREADLWDELVGAVKPNTPPWTVHSLAITQGAIREHAARLREHAKNGASQ